MLQQTMYLAFLNLIVVHCCHAVALFVLMDWKFRARAVALVWAAYVAISTAFSIALLVYAPLVVTAILTFVLTVGIHFLICIVAGEGAAGKKVFWVATYLTFFFCAVIVVAWISPLFGVYAPVAEIVTKLPLYALAVFVWKRAVKPYTERVSAGITTDWTTLALFAVLLMLGVAVFTNLVFPPMQGKTEGTSILGTLALMLIVFSSYAAMWQTIKSLKEKGEEQNLRSMNWFLQSELTRQKMYIAQAQRYRHDMHHHNQLLLSFAQEGNLAKICDYLADYDRQVHQSLLPSFCKHTVVNALLGNMQRNCDAAGIRCDFQCDIPETLPLSDVEACVVFSNLLENSFEACRQCDASSIVVHAAVRDGLLYVQMRNSVHGTVRFEHDLPVTTKQHGGIGIKSVQETLSRYGGLADFSQDGETFVVKIILPL